MAVEKLGSGSGQAHDAIVAKINELVDAVNLLGQALKANGAIWGDVPRPDGWKWE
jgi:hypothetical protein